MDKKQKAISHHNFFKTAKISPAGYAASISYLAFIKPSTEQDADTDPLHKLKARVVFQKAHVLSNESTRPFLKTTCAFFERERTNL